MAQEKPNRFVEWLLLFRSQMPVLRRQLADWMEECKEEPRLIWETSVVRYATYGITGLVLMWIVMGTVNLLSPPLPSSARPRATKADFHVVCNDPDCQHHFVIHEKFGFHKFPVICPRCHQKTGVHARQCFSATCRGRWVAPEHIGGRLKCPRCGDAILPSGK